MAATIKELTGLFFEASLMKTTPRTGWARVGIDKAESIADHTFRSMLIGYALAELEGEDPNKVSIMLLFHDFHETRLGDISWLQRYYLGSNDVKHRAAKDQAKRMPEKMAKESVSLFEEFEKQGTKVAIIAADAELLDMGLQALEYSHKASPLIQEFIENARTQLKTETAKKIFAEAEKGDAKHWWKGFLKRGI